MYEISISLFTPDSFKISCIIFISPRYKKESDLKNIFTKCYLLALVQGRNARYQYWGDSQVLSKYLSHSENTFSHSLSLNISILGFRIWWKFNHYYISISGWAILFSGQLLGPDSFSKPTLPSKLGLGADQPQFAIGPESTRSWGHQVGRLLASAATLLECCQSLPLPRQH